METDYRDIVELLVSELGKMSDKAKIVRRNKRLIIQKTIEEYLNRLTQKEQELLSLISDKYQDLLDEERRNQLIQSKQALSVLLFDAGKELQRQVKEKQEAQCYADLKNLFGQKNKFNLEEEIKTILLNWRESHDYYNGMLEKITIIIKIIQ